MRALARSCKQNTMANGNGDGSFQESNHMRLRMEQRGREACQSEHRTMNSRDYKRERKKEEKELQKQRNESKIEIYTQREREIIYAC